jgi:flagellar basal body rod protein FlgC
VTSANGKPYKAKQVVFSAIPTNSPDASGVKVQKVVEDPSPPKLCLTRKIQWLTIKATSRYLT